MKHILNKLIRKLYNLRTYTVFIFIEGCIFYAYNMYINGNKYKKYITIMFRQLIDWSEINGK